MDFELRTFTDNVWEEGDPQSWAGDALSGFGHSVKPRLVGSWRLPAAWGRAELPARAPPFTLIVVFALAQAAYAQSWPATAILFLVGFHTFARSGELFGARCGDFVRARGKGTWSLPLIKSGQRAGASESLVIVFVGTALANFSRNKGNGDLV